MLGHVLKLDQPITQDNVADAIAIALTYAHGLRFSEAISRATSGLAARSEATSLERVSSAKPRD